MSFGAFFCYNTYMEKIKILHVFEKQFRKKSLYKQQVEFLNEYHNSKRTIDMGIRQFEFTHDEIEVDIPELKTAPIGGLTPKGKEPWGADDVKRHIYPIVKPGEYDLVAFWYDAEKMESDNKYIAPFKYRIPLYVGTPMISMPDTISYKHDMVLAHEFAHAYRDLLQNPPPRDYMDSTPTVINGKFAWVPYYKNREPYAKGGNFHTTWLLYARYKRRESQKIAPEQAKQVEVVQPIITKEVASDIKNLTRVDVIGKLKKYFKIDELVPRNIASKHGESAWRVFDTNLLKNILFIREDTGLPMFVNYRGMNYRGWDDGSYRGDTSISYHKLGLAIDFNLKDQLAKETRQYIRDNYHRFPYPQGRIEVLKHGKEISWVHLDIDRGVTGKLIEFNV